MSDHQIGLLGLIVTVVGVIVAIVGLVVAKSSKKKVIQQQKVTKGSTAIQSGGNTYTGSSSDSDV
jgi:hypothetical protein